MSKYNRQQLNKKTKRLKDEISSIPSVWDQEQEEDLEKIQKQWQRRQKKHYQHRKHQQTEKKDIKKVVFGLVAVTVFAIALPFLPSAWQMTRNFMADSGSDSNTNFSTEALTLSITQKALQDPAVIDFLKENMNPELMEKIKNNLESGNIDPELLKEIQNQIKSDPELMKKVAELNESENILENTMKSVDILNKKQEEHSQNVQKAIDMSDGNK